MCGYTIRSQRPIANLYKLRKLESFSEIEVAYGLSIGTDKGDLECH